MAVKITLKGLAAANIEDRRLLDGIDCQDDFSEYFRGAYDFGGIVEENQQSLIDKGVKDGYMYFKYISGRLYLYNKCQKTINNSHYIGYLKNKKTI